LVVAEVVVLVAAEVPLVVVVPPEPAAVEVLVPLSSSPPQAWIPSGTRRQETARRIGRKVVDMFTSI
jgi:hypothetical protein